MKKLLLLLCSLFAVQTQAAVRYDMTDVGDPPPSVEIRRIKPTSSEPNVIRIDATRQRIKGNVILIDGPDFFTQIDCDQRGNCIKRGTFRKGQ